MDEEISRQLADVREGLKDIREAVGGVFRITSATFGNLERYGTAIDERNKIAAKMDSVHFHISLAWTFTAIGIAFTLSGLSAGKQYLVIGGFLIFLAGMIFASVGAIRMERMRKSRVQAEEKASDALAGVDRSISVVGEYVAMASVKKQENEPQGSSESDSASHGD